MSTFQVTLLPSQHQFLSSSRQSLLKAGLESGLNLRYGCDGGNCGECLVKLVSGRLHKIKHSDFNLTATQKNNRQFLSCCFAATSDVQIEVEEIGSVTDIPEQYIQTKVYKLHQLSDSVMFLSLKTPRSQPLSFFAGQYVTLMLEDGLSRNKSIASCPCDGLKPEFHIKKRENDAFSEYVFKQLKKNDCVTLKGPWGDFVMDDESSRPLILIAFDTGFAAIKSLIEHVIALEKEQTIRFYWLMTPENKPYMENYCKSIQHALDNFDYKLVYLVQCSTELVTDALSQIILDEKSIRHSDVYVTLPIECRSAAEKMFIEAGIDDCHWCIDYIKRI